MFKRPLNETEAESLLNYLKGIDGKLLLKEDKSVLRQIFCETDYPGLRDIIALTLVAAEDEDFYYSLIEKIKEVIHTNHVSNLIHVAHSYNCAEDIQLFIDIIILKSNMCLVEAVWVIEVMENVDKKEKQYAINKLTAYLNSLDKSSSKYEDVSIAIKLLENNFN